MVVVAKKLYVITPCVSTVFIYRDLDVSILTHKRIATMGATDPAFRVLHPLVLFRSPMQQCQRLERVLETFGLTIANLIRCLCCCCCFWFFYLC